MDGRLLKYFGEDLRWGPQDLPMPHHIIDSIRRWYTIPDLNERGHRLPCRTWNARRRARRSGRCAR